MLATVTISIEPAQEFTFQCAPGVSDRYAAAIRNAVLSVLLSQGFSGLLACNVEIESVVVDPVHSSWAAFFFAAREATERLLGLAPGHEHNIRW